MKEKEKFELAGFFSPQSAPQSEAPSANNRALDGKQRKIGLRKWPGHHVHFSASIAGKVCSRLQSLQSFQVGIRG